MTRKGGVVGEVGRGVLHWFPFWGNDFWNHCLVSKLYAPVLLLKVTHNNIYRHHRPSENVMSCIPSNPVFWRKGGFLFSLVSCPLSKFCLFFALKAVDQLRGNKNPAPNIKSPLMQINHGTYIMLLEIIQWHSKIQCNDLHKAEYKSFHQYALRLMKHIRYICSYYSEMTERKYRKYFIRSFERWASISLLPTSGPDILREETEPTAHAVWIIKHLMLIDVWSCVAQYRSMFL